MNSTKSAILAYHSLDRSGSVISIRPELFAQHMEILAESRIPIVPLSDVLTRPGSVALTFDDGYANLLDHALPVLSKHGFPATVFVVTGYCGRSNHWPSQPAGIPVLPLMGWSGLQEMMRTGITLGAHSITHPNLARLPVEEILQELHGCRAGLEDRTGAAAQVLAYPYGASDERVRMVAGREFRMACGTTLQFVEPQADRFDLPRIDAYYLRNLWLLRNLMAATGGAYLRARRLLRGVRAAARG